VINGVGLELGGRTFVPGAYHRRLQGMLLRALQHNDIPPAEVYGRMGAIKACLGHDDWAHYTGREQRLMRLYDNWRTRERLNARRPTV